MRFYARILPALLCMGLLASPVAAAESKAVQTMAGILAKLNHFPSDAEKQTLKTLIADKQTTEHERVVAEALMNVQHKVSADDKAKLDAVIKNQSAPESVKTLAGVIANLNHTPSDAEKDKLKKLTAP